MWKTYTGGDWIAVLNDHIVIIRHSLHYTTETTFHIEWKVYTGGKVFGPFLSLSSAKRQGMKQLREFMKGKKP
jgi:hypothetical protein